LSKPRAVEHGDVSHNRLCTDTARWKLDVRVGSKAALTAPKIDFRSTPVSGHYQADPVGPFGAMNGSQAHYSITSSTRASARI
jgi:hypothetical protein